MLKPIPYLRKQGGAVQLMVDDAPYLIIGGELHNSSSSSLAYMEPIWDRLKALHLNTVLAVVAWELVEPEEGIFDFSLVDGLIEQARNSQSVPAANPRPGPPAVRPCAGAYTPNALARRRPAESTCRSWQSPARTATCCCLRAASDNRGPPW